MSPASETSLTGSTQPPAEDKPAGTPITDKIAGEALEAGLRKTVQFPRTGSLLHALLARPWIDPVCLWGFKRVLPASRAWAAAAATGTSLEGFARQLGLFGLPPRLRAKLMNTHRLRLVSKAAQTRWAEIAFEGRDGDLAAAELERRRTAQSYLANRVRYISFAKRYHVSPVRYRTPSPEFVIEALAQVLADPDALFQAPDPLPTIERSKSVNHGDVIEYWLRFESEGVGDDPADTAYAHIYEPKRSAAGIPTFFFGHGLAMETEMMVDGPRSFLDMARIGMRIVLPDGPGHNRRCKPGLYGGESFLVEPPISGIQHFVRAARESAAMIAWCRAQGPGRISLGGISLGALSAQVAASRWRYWPTECRPDALFLMTSTARISALPLESSLGQMADIDNEVRRHGWRAEHFQALEPITDASAEPPLDPASIVLMVGERDDVTPAAGGHALAQQWRVPKENLFLRNRGHFSAAIGLGVDPAPYARMFAILTR
ncbi:MAG: alpha/beta hydrolase family protein [Dongiaceae bacterium]